MAGLLSLTTPKPVGFQGLEQIFEYTNDDGRLVYWNCGQAAAATLLHHLGRIPSPLPASLTLMGWLEKNFPPDQMGGWLGTSRRRVSQAFRSQGIRVRAIRGESQLRRQLALKKPVVVMLRVLAGYWKGFEIPGGHWMVAYGFDSHQVYLTNYGTMPWNDFRIGWNSWIPRLIQMRNIGLVFDPDFEGPAVEGQDDLLPPG